MSNGKHLVKCSHILQVQVKWATASYHLYRITNMCKERKCDQVPAKVVLLGNNHTSWQFINTQGRSVFIWYPSNIHASLLILSHRFFLSREMTFIPRRHSYKGKNLTNLSTRRIKGSITCEPNDWCRGVFLFTSTVNCVRVKLSTAEPQNIEREQTQY